MNFRIFLMAGLIGLVTTLPAHAWFKPHKDGYINWKNQYVVTMPRRGIPQDVIDKSYSRRVIFVNKSDQRLRLIHKGQVHGEYFVTTARSSHFTNTCNCRVGGKFRNIVLRGISQPYAKPVAYWIETDRYRHLFGVHDAYWRSNYGTRRFGEDGSLGCINMHKHDVVKVYNFVSVGDWFIIR